MGERVVTPRREGKSRNVVISVGVRDISNGVQKEATTCPIARAISRILADNFYVEVYRYSLAIVDRRTEEAIDYPLPNPATLAVIAFEKGERIVPFKFDLQVQANFIRAN